MQRQAKSGQFICYRVGQFYLLLTSNEKTLGLFIILCQAYANEYSIMLEFKYLRTAYVSVTGSSHCLPHRTTGLIEGR